MTEIQHIKKDVTTVVDRYVVDGKEFVYEYEAKRYIEQRDLNKRVEAFPVRPSPETEEFNMPLGDQWVYLENTTQARELADARDADLVYGVNWTDVEIASTFPGWFLVRYRSEYNPSGPALNELVLVPACECRARWQSAISSIPIAVLAYEAEH